MRARCHACKAEVEFPDASPLVRCTECGVTGAVPGRRPKLGLAELDEPSDSQILGVTDGAALETLQRAWTTLLEQLSAEKFPSGFRQARAAYERLKAGAGSPRMPMRWDTGTACFACALCRNVAFPRCLMCSRTLDGTLGSEVPAPVHKVESARLSSALREAETRWRAGRARETLAAAERGLGEDAKPGEAAARARLGLLQGNALATLDRLDEARGAWQRITGDPAVGRVARFGLALASYRQGSALEALHHLDRMPGEQGPAENLLRAAALHLARRFEESTRVAHEIRAEDSEATLYAGWIEATSAHESGDDHGALAALAATLHPPVVPEGFSIECGPAEDAPVPQGVAWLVGVTLGALGRLDHADAWFQWGTRRHPDQAAFTRELVHLAIRRRDWDTARRWIRRAREQGDSSFTAGGGALVAVLSGGAPVESLLEHGEKNFDAKACLIAGRLLERKGRTNDALRAFSRAAQIDPRYAAPLVDAGALLAREGAIDKAGNALHGAWNRGDRSDRLLRALATVLIEQGRISDAVPKLELLVARHPEQRDAMRNLAAGELMHAVEEANEGREDDATEIAEVALERLVEAGKRYRPLLGELLVRAARRALTSKGEGSGEVAVELATRAEECGVSAPRARRVRGLARLASIARSEVPEGTTIATLARMAADDFLAAGNDSRSRLHRAVALQIAGQWDEADALLDRVIAVETDIGLRVRARWARAMSLGRASRFADARAMLREAIRESAEAPGLEAFGRAMRLQMLKFRGAEGGAEEIERRILAIPSGDRKPEALLLYGITLASQQRFDEAARALEQAARDRQLRPEADSTRHLMQLSRVSTMIREERIEEAARLLTKIRSTLPPDPEIDMWLHALEHEGLPVAALRSGDGRTAVARWSSRLQGWRKAKDLEYWETVRSVAIAAHRTAISFEKKGMPLEAEKLWPTAIDRWVELMDAPAFWDAYTERGRSIFGELEPALVAEARDELVEKHLVELLGEVIGGLRSSDQELVAASRFGVLERIQSWRWSREPASEELRDAVATCHAQRLIIYLGNGMWNEARQWGEKACETQPENPVHFNNMAEAWGGEAQPLLQYVNRMVETGQGGPELRPYALKIVDLLSLALAWNPHHPHIQPLYANIVGQLQYLGVPSGDPRVQRAAKLRQHLPAGSLEAYSRRGSEPEPDDAPAVDDDVPRPEQIIQIAQKLKASGITEPEQIYEALALMFPSIRQLKKELVMTLIVAA